MTTQILDLSDKDVKLELKRQIGVLTGKYEITWKKHRPKRTNPQNSFYWAVIVTSLWEHLREQDPAVTKTQAHDHMRVEFLKKEIVNQETGEIMATVIRSTTELDVKEFSEYVEKCIYWLTDFWGMVLPSLEEYNG